MIVHEWLLFTAQTPASPSSLRVLVWRRMQHLGALLVHNGVWMLPHTAGHVQAINDLMTELETHGGYGFFFFARPADIALEQHILDRFQSEREQEYSEFEQRCTLLLQELEWKVTNRKFTLAELEKNEEDLHKLTGWLRKIQTHDFFGGPHHDTASAMLARCRQAMASFTTLVYEKTGLEGTVHPFQSSDSFIAGRRGHLHEDEHQL